MTTNELRIGNLVKEMNTLFKVTGIGFNSISCEPLARVNSLIYHTMDLIIPIPLTEEWLLRFGFELYCGEYGYKRIKIFKTEKDKFILSTTSQEIGNEFYYVHQLQNLYFALKGEELEIKN